MDGQDMLPKQARYQLRYPRLWNCFVCGLSCGLGRFSTSGFVEIVPASGSVPAGCGGEVLSSWMGKICSQKNCARLCSGGPGRSLTLCTEFQTGGCSPLFYRNILQSQGEPFRTLQRLLPFLRLRRGPGRAPAERNAVYPTTLFRQTLTPAAAMANTNQKMHMTRG